MDIRIEKVDLSVGGQGWNVKDLCWFVLLPAVRDGISIPAGAGLICMPGAFVALPCRTRLAA